MVGERGNARAMAVPTVMESVAPIATDDAMKAVLVVSAAQHDSKPSSSTIFAIGPISWSGPPIPIA
jgi:hypothetical protein